MANRVFEDPASGNRMQFTVITPDLLEIDAVYAPRSPRPPVHFHPHQGEHFEVRSGSMNVLCAGVERVYRAGESFAIPAAAPHSMWNTGDTSAHVIWQTRPALQTQAFFETSWGLAQDGKEVGSNLLQAAVILRTYQEEFRLVKPPRLIQQIMFGLLAPVGRLLGYRAQYDAYSS